MTQYTVIVDKLSQSHSSTSSPVHNALPYNTFTYNTLHSNTNNAIHTPHKQRNLVVLGSSMCGKTCICIRYTLDRFDDSYEPTMQNTYTKTVYRHNGIYDVVIRDTQGLTDSESIGSEFGVGYHGYIIAFSITSRKSYDTAKIIYKKLIQLIGTQSIPIIFVGNKIDVINTTAQDSKQSQYTNSNKSIQRSEVIQYLNSLNTTYTIPYIECSARHNINIDNVYDAIIDEIDQSFTSTNKQYLRFYMLQPQYIITYMQAKLMSTVANLNIHTIEYITQLLITLTLLLNAMLLVMAVLIDQNELYIDDSEFTGYICFAFSLLHLIVCTLGLIGIHRQTIEYLYIYKYTVTLINLIELIILIWMCNTFESLDDYTRRLYTVLLYVIIAVTQLLSCLSTHIFTSQVQLNQQTDDDLLYMYPGFT